MTASPPTIRVATRGSDLAMAQTHAIVARMREVAPDREFEIVTIVTHGDRFQHKPIAEMGETLERGIFNTALEEAVLSGEASLATCSFKDVESDLPEGLVAESVLEREDTRDVLVTRHGCGLAELPQGAVLATSSPRRTSQLRAYRPDLQFEPLRGNVPTRVLRDVARFDGVIVAAAGVRRLGLEHTISEYLPPEVLLSAPAQGAMGCEYLAANTEMADLVRAIQHAETQLSASSEKALLVALSGGCFAPIGVHAQVRDGQLHMACRIVSADGARKVELADSAPTHDAAMLIARIREAAMAEGAGEIIAETRSMLEGK